MRRHLLLLLALSALSACSTYKPVPLGTVPAPVAPSGTEVAATKHAVVRMAQQEGYTRIEKGPAVKRVNTIYAKLARGLQVPAGQYPIYVYDAGDEVNASAVNGNTIIVYSKLVERVKSDGELATVLAHEMGHILAQHKQDEDADSKGTAIRVGGFLLGTVAAVASAYSGAGGAVSDLAGDVTQTTVEIVGEGALLRSYDRAQEYEADQIGLMVMAKAGYDPSEAVRFWDRAEEVFGDTGGLAFLSTHPASGDRAEALQEALPTAMEYYKSAGKAPLQVAAKR